MKFLHISLVLFVLTLISCKKEDTQPNTPNTEIGVSDPVIINAEYLVIDSNDQILISTDQELLNGTYIFNSSVSEIADIGTLIVGTQGSGFLRRVTSVSQSGSQITYETTFASMSELFSEGDVNFDVNLNDSYQYKSNLNHTFSNYELINSNGVTAIMNGSAELNIPAINTELSFTTSGPDKLLFETVGAEFNGTLTLDITANGNLPVFSFVDTLVGFKKKFIYPGPFGIPIVGVMTTDFIIRSTVNIAVNGNTSVTFENNSPIDLQISYENGSWQSDISFTPNNNVSFDPINGGIQSNYTVALVPTINIEFYGVSGPYGSVSLNNSVNAEIASPSLDWDFSTSVWVGSTIGISADIFDINLFDYNTSWSSQLIEYVTPYQLEKVSGDNQIGPAGTPLQDPIRVRVIDKDGSPQSNVPVYFSVSQGGGSLSSNNILTDANGLAEVIFTPGSTGMQNISVVAKKANQDNLNSSPQTFTANGNVFVQQRLDFGETPLQIYSSGIPLDSLYFKSYAGGRIFYLNTNTGSGLVASSSTMYWMKWTEGTPTLIGTSTNLGTGQSNTFSIVGVQGTGVYAAQEANDLVSGGYNDWYLPSKDELQALRDNWEETGFSWTGSTLPMWSSSEVDNNSAWALIPETNIWTTKTKTQQASTPHIRSF
ncbi:MAG: hypothetical protein HWE22_15425 [Flavobacteriales bacterium]|nr:hypothetical protein [Flavobacteriales bacterium]